MTTGEPGLRAAPTVKEMADALHAVDDDVQFIRRDARNFPVLAQRILNTLAAISDDTTPQSETQDGERLDHGYSPRPEWAGTCPRCGAAAGTNCAVISDDRDREVERIAGKLRQIGLSGWRRGVGHMLTEETAAVLYDDAGLRASGGPT